MNTRISQLVTFLLVSIVSSTAGHALTLGDLRGTAVLGQPLDVSVRVGAGESETVSDDCLSAQLLFGDFPQRTPSLHVQTSTTGDAPASLVRIRSIGAVSEPVVTVVLRATCGSTTSRSYVLLSDFPAADLPVISAAPLVQPAGATSPVQKAPPVVTDLQPLTVAPAPRPAQTSRPAVVAKPKRAKAVPAATAPSRKPSPALPPVNETPSSDATATATSAAPDSGRLVLKLDSEMIILNPEELAALAALRASLPALEPEGEVLKQSLQLEALQNDLQTFKDLTRKNQATLAELEAKLSQTEAERIPMIWLYLLGGLLAAALGALAWVLRQQQNSKAAWWQHDDADAVNTIGPITKIDPTEPATVSSPMMDAPAPSAPVEPAPPVIDLDFDLDHLSQAADLLPEASPQATTRSDPLGITCDLNSETIADMRQQTDFFVSLGQTPRAINLLYKHIRESTEPHPLVYLDLLALYHSQGMKADFRELRLEFNRLFNAVVPDFPAFYQEGRGLLDYPEQLAELVRVWPNWEAAPLLEACIFRCDTSAPHVGFDLAAFRDLLLLRNLVDYVNTGELSLVDKPFDLPEPPARPAAYTGLATADDASSLAVTVPGVMPVTPSVWASPLTVPTTEELELDFPIDIFNPENPPKS